MIPRKLDESLGCNTMALSECQESSESSQPVIADFRISDGRRYHNVPESNYPLPNDDEECDRLHMQHFLWRYIWQNNFSAPVDEILRQEGSTALDVGCGAASWIFEMASNYPYAQFTGVDISSIQPSGIKPINVNFIQANVFMGLPFEDNSFDFIFQRFLLAGIPEDKWETTIDELTRVLKPGGFLELMEVEVFTHNLGPNTKRLHEFLCDFMKQKSLDPVVAYKLKSYLEEQGQLESIHAEEKPGYFGTEAGKLGQVLLNNYEILFQSGRGYMPQVAGMTLEEYDKLLDDSFKECKELNSTTNSIRVYARKI